MQSLHRIAISSGIPGDAGDKAAIKLPGRSIGAYASEKGDPAFSISSAGLLADIGNINVRYALPEEAIPDNADDDERRDIKDENTKRLHWNSPQRFGKLLLVTFHRSGSMLTVRSGGG